MHRFCQNEQETSPIKLLLTQAASDVEKKEDKANSLNRLSTHCLLIKDSPTSRHDHPNPSS